MYNTIKNLKIKKGDRVLLRLDLNVPINKKGEIVNDFRIKTSIPTVLKLQKLKAKTIIIAHKESGSLLPVYEYLKKKIKKVHFNERYKNIEDGEVLLLENLRLNEGEKKNDISFAKYLSSFADFYINDAFSASHRTHASIVGVPQLLGKDRCAIGPNFEDEIKKLEVALKGEHPLFLIIGGAKFETKLGLLEKYINIADKIFVGGALAHTFWQMQNINIGKSLIDNEVKLSKKIIEAYKKGKIILPLDVTLQNKKMIEVKDLKNVKSSDFRVTDFGKNTLEGILDIAQKSKTIIWNGPLGYYEGGFDWGTKELMKGLGKMKTKKIILGGGDTVAVAENVLKKNKTLKFTHVSTGGGAMIDFLSNGNLPGLKVLS
jgi:phosphoglycerate kinase